MERPEEEEGGVTAAEAKVDRLAEDISDLRTSIVDLPVGDSDRLKVQRQIGALVEERELLLERQRCQEVVREFLADDPPILLEECPICLESIGHASNTSRLLCCGNRMCTPCWKNPKSKWQGGSCPLCREPFPEKEDMEELLQSKADQGFAWANLLRAEFFCECEDDADEKEALLRRAMSQGSMEAAVRLGVHLCEKSRGFSCSGVEDHELFSEGETLLLDSISKGSTGAMSHLGSIYLSIYLDANVDRAEGLRLCTISATMTTGDIASYTRLGYAFLPFSPSRAKHYFKPGVDAGESEAEKGYGVAMLELARETYDGELHFPGYSPVPQALFWYRRSLVSGQGSCRCFTRDLKDLDRLIRARCANCSMPLGQDSGRKCCVECRAAYYCGRDCQVAHWKAGHKKDCMKSISKSLREENPAAFDDYFFFTHTPCEKILGMMKKEHASI